MPPPLDVIVPGSKSITQRALVVAALSANQTPVDLDGALLSDDSRHLSEALTAFGATVTWAASGDFARVTPPTGGVLRTPAEPLSCGNAGTAVRFLSAFALLIEGPLTIDGNDRMRQRPIGPLADALKALNVRVEFSGHTGCPPLTLRRLAPAPRHVSVDTELSSQFASALLLVAPRLAEGLELRLTGPLVSRPYLDMTLTMLNQIAGVEFQWQDARTVSITPKTRGYHVPERIMIEPDWSAAAFLLAAGFVTQRRVIVHGLLPPGDSLQGDAVFATWIRQFEAPQVEYRFDLTDTPDLLPPLAAAALFAPGRTHLSGAAHARVKECDRLAVLTRQFRRLGAEIDERPDGMSITPLPPTRRSVESVELDTADDHRMAMAFGVVGLRVRGFSIRNPACVSKSFPTFWDVLSRFG